MNNNFQQRFMSSLTGDSALNADDKIIPCRNLSIEEALKIYQNNYYRNLQTSLNQTYEACTTLMSEELFEKLSFAFIQQYPPQKGDLALYGEEFPQFLRDSDTITSNWPFLPDLAELEKMIKQLFLHGQTHIEMAITFPVHQIWQSLLHGSEDIDDIDGKKLLSIHRDDNEHLFFELREIS